MGFYSTETNWDSTALLLLSQRKGEVKAHGQNDTETPVRSVKKGSNPRWENSEEMP